MIVPLVARYNFVTKKSYDFIMHEKIKEFPINPFDIIQKNRWSLRTFSELALENNCTLKDICEAFSTDEAYTIYSGRNYTIAYNDKKYYKRVLFTLMHEIGHIFLCHFTDFDKSLLCRGGLTTDEYKVLENEANAFARNVLAPAPVVEQLKHKKWEIITKYYGISKEAAKTRLNFLYRDKKNLNNLGLTLNIIKQFRDYFNKKSCTTCQHFFISNKAKFCPICGNQTLKWGDGKMIYEKMEVYENKKLKECPRCKNEETNIEGNYCQICSMYLINKCKNMNCGAPLETNARYCPKCSCKSTFFENKILKAWNYHESDGFMNIPDGVEDEGLPFN